MNFLVQQKPAYVYTGSRPFDATKPSVLFIHGAANDHSVWTLQARFFAHHGWNALAVDLPGHGRSFAEAKSNVEEYADWVVNLLDNGAIPNVVMVGHSMGSLIALDCAIRYPTRVRSVALLGCSVPMPVAEPLMLAANSDPQAAFAMLNLWGHAPALKLGRNPTPGSSSLMSYQRLLEQSRPGVLATDLRACDQYRPNAERLKSVAAPTLLLTGSEDMMTPPRAAKQLHEAVSSSQLQLINGVGHAVMQEAPGQVLEALRAHVQRLA